MTAGAVHLHEQALAIGDGGRLAFEGIVDAGRGDRLGGSGDIAAGEGGQIGRAGLRACRAAADLLLVATGQGQHEDEDEG